MAFEGLYILNEKEKAKQVKTFVEKKRTKKWNGNEFSVQEDKQIKLKNKLSGDLRSASHSAKFPTCENKF